MLQHKLPEEIVHDIIRGAVEVLMGFLLFWYVLVKEPS